MFFLSMKNIRDGDNHLNHHKVNANKYYRSLHVRFCPIISRRDCYSTILFHNITKKIKIQPKCCFFFHNKYQRWRQTPQPLKSQRKQPLQVTSCEICVYIHPILSHCDCYTIILFHNITKVRHNQNIFSFHSKYQRRRQPPQPP